MLKKILFSLLCALMTYSICVAAYRIFEPREEYSEPDSSSYISYASLKEYIVSSGESSEHLLLFFNPNDSDSVYVKTTLLNEVERQTSTNLSSMIEIIDVSGVNSEKLPQSLAKDWGISSCPTFALVKLVDGQPDVESRLEWSNAQPLTSSMILQWLKDTGIAETK